MRLPKEYENYIISEYTLKAEDIMNSIDAFIQSIHRRNLIEKEDYEKFEVLNREFLVLQKLIVRQKKRVKDYWKLEKVQKWEYISSCILNEEVWDLVNSISPEGCYFSSSEGDGACFGLWKNEPEDEETEDETWD